MATKLYVGNLSWETTKDDLFAEFGKFGEVQDAFIPLDRDSGRSRGFGFVTMNSDEAQNAIQSMDGAEFMGRNIRVNEAQPQGERGGRGGGGFNGGGGGGYGGRGGGRGRGRGRGYGDGGYGGGYQEGGYGGGGYGGGGGYQGGY